jgi:hypothetical protein
MGRIIVGFLALGCVFAGWRNLPRIPDASSGAAGILLGAVVVLAYFIGRRRAYASAMAVAMARAEASAAARATSTAASVSNAQVLVQIDPGVGARAVGEREHGRPEWIVGDRHVELEANDATDSMLADVMEVDHQTG